MRIRWRLILPVIGLVLFAIVSYGSFKRNRETGLANNRYFWWSSVRLNSDPLNKHPRVPTPCKDTIGDCINWFAVLKMRCEGRREGWVFPPVGREPAT